MIRSQQCKLKSNKTSYSWNPSSSSWQESLLQTKKMIQAKRLKSHRGCVLVLAGFGLRICRTCIQGSLLIKSCPQIFPAKILRVPSAKGTCLGKTTIRWTRAVSCWTKRDHTAAEQVTLWKQFCPFFNNSAIHHQIRTDRFYQSLTAWSMDLSIMLSCLTSKMKPRFQWWRQESTESPFLIYRMPSRYNLDLDSIWFHRHMYNMHIICYTNVNFPWMFFVGQSISSPSTARGFDMRLDVAWNGSFNELATKTGEVTYDPQNGHAVPTMTTNCMFLFNVKSYDPDPQVASLIWICFMAQNINHVAANHLRKSTSFFLDSSRRISWFMFPIFFNKPESTKSTMAST